MGNRVCGRRLALALAACVLLLTAACGGGGDTSTAAAPGSEEASDIPTAPPAQPAPPAGGSAPGATPSDPADPTDPDDPAEEPGGSDPVDPVPPAVPIPQPPAALASFPDLEGIRAVAVEPASGRLFALRASSGELFEWAPDAETPALRGTVTQMGIRAMAYVPARERLYAVANPEGTTESELLSIDLQTLTAERVATLRGVDAVEALALRSRDGGLYGVTAGDDRLVRIDLETAEVHTVGALGEEVGLIAGLAYDEEADAFYGVDTEKEALFAIDPETGAASHRADLPAGPYEGIAFRAESRTFFAANAGTNTLEVIDPMGSRYGFEEILGLAYDPREELLYGSHVGFGMILGIDPATGWKHEIAYVATPALESLAFDAATRRLFGISSATQNLYRIAVDPGEPQPISTIGKVLAPTGTRSWTSLSGLTWGGGTLYAVDTVERTLLRIDPNTGGGFVLAPLSTDQAGGVRSLAFDEASGVLHAFADEGGTHLVIDPNAGYEVRLGEAGRFASLGGLAWDADGERLLGTEPIEDELVTVYEEAPTATGPAHLTALAFDATSDLLLGFDEIDDHLVAIDLMAGTAHAVTLAEGLHLTGMATLQAERRLLAVDGRTGTLYDILPDHRLEVVGAERGLAALEIEALAWVPGSALLFAADAASGELVRIDPQTGAVIPHPVGWTSLGYATVDAMGFDDGSGRLIAVDRATRTLLDIDPETGVAIAIATLELTSVSGLCVAAHDEEIYVADRESGIVAVLDRYTGEVLEPLAPVLRHRGVSEEIAVGTPWWPQGDVRLDGLRTWAFTTSLDYGDDGDLVFLRGDEVLYRAPFHPEMEIAIEAIPPAVREKVKVGDVIRWGIDVERGDDALVTVTIVDRPAAASEQKALQAHPYLKEQAPPVPALRSIRVLGLHALHGEAFEALVRLDAKHPGNVSVRREILRSIRSLGISDRRLPDVWEISRALTYRKQASDR